MPKSRLVEFMKQLGYKIAREGACEGAACAAQHAASNGDYDKFLERMKFIGNLPEHTSLPALIVSAEDHQREIKQAILSQDLSKPLPNMSLTKEEAILLTIKAFFFEVCVSHDPTQLHLFLEQKGVFPQQMDKRLYEEFAAPSKSKRIEKPKTFVLGGSDSTILDVLKKIEKTGLALGLIVSDYGHSVHIFYDSDKACWYLTNQEYVTRHDSLDDLRANLLPVFSTTSVFPPMYLRIFYPLEHNKVKSADTEPTVSDEQTEEGIPEKMKDLFSQLTTIEKESLQRNIEGDELDLRQLLLLAIIVGEGELAIPLLNTGKVELNYLMHNGSTLLHFAALIGSKDIVKALLEKGALVVARKDGWTPLHVAAEKGQLGVVECFQNYKALINAPDHEGITPLYLATKNDHPDIVKFLLENGAQVDIGTLYLVISRHDLEMVRFMLPYIKNINQENRNTTPLILAVKLGDVDMVELLLKAGAQANQALSDGNTAFMVAVMNNRLNIVDLLLRGHYVDVNAPQKTAPLSIAIGMCNMALIEKLLEGYGFEHTRNYAQMLMEHFLNKWPRSFNNLSKEEVVTEIKCIELLEKIKKLKPGDEILSIIKAQDKPHEQMDQIERLIMQAQKSGNTFFAPQNPSLYGDILKMIQGAKGEVPPHPQAFQ